MHLYNSTEILERNQSQFESSIRNIKEQFDTLGEKFTAGKLGSFSLQNHLKETDCHLRTGDSFRLRSVKFPDYEMGVTSVKLRDEFCYVGLRKVTITVSCDLRGQPISISAFLLIESLLYLTRCLSYLYIFVDRSSCQSRR